MLSDLEYYVSNQEESNSTAPVINETDLVKDYRSLTSY